MVDMFTLAQREAPLEREWPEPLRFPLNQDGVRVEDIVLRDLKESKNPLLVTGFATLDRLIDFIADAQNCKQIRIVFGSEPFDSRRDVFTLKDNDLPRQMKEYWLERGISVLLSGKLLVCIERLQKRKVLARYVAHSTWRLHAKIYIGDKAASLGSSNFTGPGLHRQLEANARFERADSDARGRRAEEHQRYEETAQIAEQFWELGKDYNDQLIALLEELLRLVPWQEAIARASAELLEGDWAKKFLRGEYLPGDQPLWPSQKQGIAQALYIMKERGSVLVADATGSGKTKAGMHLIGAKMHEIISSNRLRQGKALLIAPPSVVPNWEKESSRAMVPVDIYSHGTLSHSKSAAREHLVENLRRAQLLCVDEGHNFLNIASNRSQELLRNMADHVALFTATPINKSAVDLLRIADMLGADNLEESTVEAFGKLLSQKSLNRSLSEEEIAQLRSEIAKFTLRRTKRMLNDLIAKNPESYRDATGRPCRFPKHKAEVYSLNEPEKDRELAARIRKLAGDLKGVLFFRKTIEMPAILRKRGYSEERYLEGRLKAASKLAQYMVMRDLRSSRTALVEAILGTDAAAKEFQLKGFTKTTTSGDVLGRLAKASGKPPKSKLKIGLPDWLTNTDAHREACEQEARIYEAILDAVRRMSDSRERRKAEYLAKLSKRFKHILAFDHRPITLAYIEKLLKKEASGTAVLVATGDAHSSRGELLKRFSPESDIEGIAIGLCSDSVSEGVNLQRAEVVMHLDMPTVVRIAEQRVGRVDRLDSPHRKIYAFWPQDAEEFALRSDETFIERYETVDNLLGSNMPLPEEVRGKPQVVDTHDAIKEYETKAGEWDGIEDAFSPVRALVSGDQALIPEQTYIEYEGIKARVMSRVSLVTAKKPWAFFCTMDSSGVPKWILLKDRNSLPETDLKVTCELLRQRLGPEVQDVGINSVAEDLLRQFIERLSRAERRLLSRRKQRALEEMEFVVAKYLESASRRKNQQEIDVLKMLLDLLQKPPSGLQPDWEEVASRWLDLIRSVWYEKLQDKGRNKPLLLKDIRKAVVAAESRILPRLMNEFMKTFPAQKSADERIVACIVGVA